MFFFRPPFRACSQKELAEKIKEGKFRRIPYRYSEQLNELLKEMLNVKVRINYSFFHLELELVLKYQFSFSITKETDLKQQLKYVQDAERLSQYCLTQNFLTAYIRPYVFSVKMVPVCLEVGWLYMVTIQIMPHGQHGGVEKNTACYNKAVTRTQVSQQVWILQESSDNYRCRVLATELTNNCPCRLTTPFCH